MSTSSIKMGVAAAKDLNRKLEKMKKQSEGVVNKTVSDFKTRAPAWVNQSVSDVYNIKKSDVKADYKGPVKLDKKGWLQNVGLKYKGRVRTLRTFGMKPLRPPKKREKEFRRIPGQGTDAGGEVATVKPPAPYKISVEIKKGERHQLEGNVFLGSNNGSAYIPFARVGENRKDIKVLNTASVPSMIHNEQVQVLIQERVDTGLEKRLEHHLEQELKKRK